MKTYFININNTIMKMNKTIIKALMALLVIMLCGNFNAEAQLGGLIGAAKDLASQKGAKIPKVQKKGKPTTFRWKSSSSSQGATIGTWNPATLEITFNMKGANGQFPVYKIDPSTGAVTGNDGKSKGSMNDDGTIVSPNLGTLTVKKKTDIFFDVIRNGQVIGQVSASGARPPIDQMVFGIFDEDVSPLLVAYIYFGVMLPEDQVSDFVSGYGVRIATEEVEDLVNWMDKSTINEIMEYESSRPYAGWKRDEHPEFKNLKVVAVGLISEKWDERYYWIDGGRYMSDAYFCRYYAVYELADGKNVVMMATARKEFRYGDIKDRLDPEFHVITDWVRK